MTHRTFEEKQRFNQPLLWVIIIGASLVIFINIPLGLINSSTADNQPLDLSSTLILIFSLLFIVGLNAMFYLARLKTKIDGSGVEITFQPFINKPLIYKWNEIEKAYVRKYKPLWEYGGWGVRYRWNSRAYNTAGNMGLQLILKSGRKVLIGTQKPDDMKTYLNNYIFIEIQ